MVCQSTAKTAKIGSLENFRLYGIYYFKYVSSHSYYHYHLQLETLKQVPVAMVGQPQVIPVLPHSVSKDYSFESIILLSGYKRSKSNFSIDCITNIYSGTSE